VGSHLSGGCSTTREQIKCCGCWGNHTAIYRGCVNWKEAKAAIAKQAPERGRKSVAIGKPAAPKAQRVGPSAEQMDLDEGWNHFRGGRVVKATATPPTKPNPSHSIQSVTEACEKPGVTATRKTGRPEKPQHKPTIARKEVTGKAPPPKKAAASVKTVAVKPTTPTLIVPTQTSTSPLEEIFDLLDQLPLQACVELIRRLLTSIASLPTSAAHSRVVLTILLFVAEYGSTP